MDKAILLLIKNVQVRTLVSGDKTGRITLETLNPEDIEMLAVLASLENPEIYVSFSYGISKS